MSLRAKHRYSLVLEAPTPDEIASRMRPADKRGVPMQIGFGRDLANRAPDLATIDWEALPDGGRAAAIDITSPNAAALRVALRIVSLPSGAIVRFQGSEDATAFEATADEILETIDRNADAGDKGPDAHMYWSPVLEGSTATIEIEVPPATQLHSVRFTIPSVSHLVTSIRSDFMLPKAADFCELDVMCYSAWSNESNAVARIVFTTNHGSFLCSGTLLADQDISTVIPYFLTANHCISTQSVASTLTSYWFYRSSACGSGFLGSYQILGGGATLLYASANTDTSFLRLNAMPPAGVTYAGWILGSPPPVGTAATGIHHPKGDKQKISFGNVSAYATCTPPDPVQGTFSCNYTTVSSATFYAITWSSGIVEGGSSGSGIFQNNGHYLVGQLYGGSSSCATPIGPDFYGRFDAAYLAALHQWLGVTPVMRPLTVSSDGNGKGSVTSTPSGINCGTTCSAYFVNSTAIELFATASAGSVFTGWASVCNGSPCACSGTGRCLMNLTSNVLVTANFTDVATMPGPPQNLTPIAGSGEAVFTFDPPATTGGSAIRSYTVTCNQGGMSASANGSPITVKGLSYGVTYSCTATSTNASSTSLPSSPVSVTPIFAPPLALVAVQSRKTHGIQGTYNLPIDTTHKLSGPITVEPRMVGTGHRIVFTFNNPITSIGTAQSTNAVGAPYGTLSVASSGNEVTATLTGVADNSRVSVSISGINGSGTAGASVGFLVGDVRGSRSVTASHILRMKGRVGQAVDTTNYIFDVDLQGTLISNNDVLETKVRSGFAMP